MAIARADIIVGPAKYTFGSAIFYSTNDVGVNLNTATANTEVNGMLMEELLTDATVDLSVKPDGHLTAALITGLWPYKTTFPGTSVGGTTVALNIEDVNSHKHIVRNAVISKMPDLYFGLDDTIIGEVGFTGIRTVEATSWSADTLYTPAVSGGTFTDTTFTKPIKQEYTAVWTGKTGWSATPFYSATGFRVRIDTQINWHQAPTPGTFLGTFVNATVAVECEPAGPSAIEAFNSMSTAGADLKRGSSVTTLGATLTITGEADSTIVFTLPHAQLVRGSYRFGTGQNQLRNGQFAFVAARSLTSGAFDSLFTLADT